MLNKGIGVWRDYGVEGNFDRRMAEIENWTLEDEAGFDVAEGDSDANEGGYDSLADCLHVVRDDKFAEHYKNAEKEMGLVYYEIVVKN